MAAFNLFFTGAAADASTAAAALSSADVPTQALMTAVANYVSAYAATKFAGKNVDVKISANVDDFGVYLHASLQEVRLVFHNTTNSGQVATGNVQPTP